MKLWNKFKKIFNKSKLRTIGNDFIEIEYPHPYAFIGAKFTISGWVHLSWFDTDYERPDWRMFVDYLALDVKIFMGTAPSPILDDTNMRGDKVYFSIPCELTWANIGFIEKSHGRITIKIESPNRNIDPIYIPLIVKQFEDTSTADLEVIKRHSLVGETEKQYIQDLKIYNDEMRKVYENRQAKDQGKIYEYLHNQSVSVASGMYQLLGEEEEFTEYTYSEDDKREDELNEKYKDALEWRGPLAGGIVSRFNGFELRVYSDDHDKHFHVIHKAKGVDARFSFPDINLMNYKNTRNTISSKMEKKITEYCLQPEIFKIFNDEFNKRESK